LISLHDIILQIPTGLEWVIIIVVIIVIFFGVKKVPEIARSFGKATSEYQKARIQAERELGQIKNGGVPKSEDRSKLEEIAGTLGIDHSSLTNEELRDAIEAELHKTKSSSG
jgi:sec-independent protein translocase protein TatA